MKTNALTLIITLVVGVILVGSLLAPVISNAQTTIGDPITYTNTGPYGELYVTDDVSGTHTIVMSAADNTITYDGEVITNPIRGYLVISDAITVAYTGSYLTICYGSDQYQFNANWGNSYDITFENGTATMIRTSSSGNTTFTEAYTWIGYNVSEGGNYINVSSATNVYSNGVKNMIAMGNYTTGDNDTFYIVKDGKVSLSNTTYTGSVALRTDTLVAGTTDVTNSYMVISVDDETFTPYVWAVEKTIMGHESGGASYTLLGAIPILLIVALLMAAIGAIALRRND